MLVEWDQIEGEAISQIMKVASLDITKKLAIMPDVHAGYDLCIGGVALLDNHISPSFVGYDIGCGMCYIDTGVRANEILTSSQDKRNILEEIYKRIPVGFSIRDRGIEYEEFRSASGSKELDKKVNEKLEKSLGTLGGGNHFIELGESEKTGNLCITIHSGSRNIGHSVASYYMKQNRFFELDSELGQAYLRDMNFCLQYALANRLKMIEEIIDILGLSRQKKKIMRTLVNENHNHAIVTEDGVLHRKGATPAEKGQIGIIPANMRDGVFVTVGLGNEEYLCSSSHGAGRKLSRKKAKEQISLEDFERTMEENEIVARVCEATKDESPFAYKDINDVIEAQRGKTIEVIDRIRPLVNVKG